MAINERQLISVDEFEDFIARPENNDRRFQLIHGEIVEKMPTREHGVISGNVVTEFNLFLRKHPLGLAAVEARHRPAGDLHNDRMPDVSVVLGDKPVEREGAAEYMPDVVVEVQSPDDSWREMIRRGVFYLDHGAKIVLLVYPAKKQVEVLMGDDKMLLNIGDVIDLTAALPEFTIAVADVFRGV